MQTSASIAMWSGPRNVSTALMRSFGSRSDTVVCDEPFYAHYLSHTGLPHPMAAEIMARHETDWRTLVRRLSGPVPDGRRIFFQKHMAHHLLPHIDRGWLSGLRHAFLIRRPDEMLASLAAVLPAPRLADTGLPQQVELFDHLHAESGVVPPVIDGADLLADPAGLLAALCQRLEIPFEEAMLSWKPGLRETDGCWAAIWYQRVAASTGFAPRRAPQTRLDPGLQPLLARCQPLYDQLHAQRLGPA